MKILKVVLALSVVFFVAAKPKKTYSRAKPPEKWDKSTISCFENDAFSLLKGERPKSFVQENKTDNNDKNNKEEEKVDVESKGDFDRRDMMKKLASAEEGMASALNNEKSFVSASSKIESNADLFIMMGRTLFNSDPDYNDDDTYLKHAEEMFTNAKQIKIFVKKGDYEGASSAFSRVKKSCNSCHEKFR